MMMRTLILLAALAPLCAQANALRCVPDKICVPGNCDVAITEEAHIRMTHPDSMAPALQSHGETVPMAKTFEHRGQSSWAGMNAAGEYESVSLDRERMQFRYWIGKEPVRYVQPSRRYYAYGQCVEQ